MSDTARVLVCVPTYNEILNVGRTVARIREAVPAADVLVIDDSSPDGTGAAADALATADPRVHVLHRDVKEGLGAAYLAGFAWGLERGYDVLCEMDADGSHPATDLPALLSAVAKGADLAIGSRWVPGGSVVNWPRRREVLSRGGNAYIRLALGLGVHDATAGFRAFRAPLLRELGLADVASQGYCFQVDLTLRAADQGAVIVELPITFVERELGASKMSGAIVREAMWRVTVWGAGRRARQIIALTTGRRESRAADETTRTG